MNTRLIFTLTILVVAGIGLAVGLEHMAYAAGTDTAASAAVPVVGSPTDAWGALQQYGYIWGGMLIVYAIGTAFAKKAEDEHWINAGHALSIITGSLGVIGAAIQAKFGGGSWAIVPMTLMGVVTLVIQRPKKVEGGGASPAITAAAGAAIVMLCIAMSMLPGCATVSKDLKAGGSAGISCAEAKIGQTVPEVGMTLGEDAAGIVLAGADGWQGELDKLKAKYTADAVDCAVKIGRGIWAAQTGGALMLGKPANVARADAYLAGKTFR